MLTENPLHCDCQAQELWEWMRDHQKLIRGNRKGEGENSMGISDADDGLLRCGQPGELRGLIFLELDPHAFCSAPLVTKITVQDVRPNSAVVIWQSRNHSGLHGYQVAYREVDNGDEVRELSI